jgi:group I intron endonuclease
MFYVYSLINPINNKIFYIGMGSGKRMYVHEQKAKHNKPFNNNWKLFREIKDILDNGFNVQYTIIADHLSQTDALLLESAKIKEVGIENLCNLNFGGTGRPIGYKHSPETRQKIATSNTGKIKSTETKRLIGESKKGNKNMLGKSHTTATKQKISDSWVGRDLQSYANSQSHRRKKVIQYSLSGDIIKVWDSVTSAVKYNGQSVCDVIYGRQKTAYGCVWKLLED